MTMVRGHGTQTLMKMTLTRNGIMTQTPNGTMSLTQNGKIAQSMKMPWTTITMQTDMETACITTRSMKTCSNKLINMINQRCLIHMI